jgi:tocopherol O-methyltransferase
MLSCPTVEKRVIRDHYNLATPFYRLFWGPHIHHGFWTGDESPRSPQVELTDRLASLAAIAVGQQIVDIGCGMGASSIHLAKTRRCRSLGITISPVQRHWASISSRWHRVNRNVGFRCADAEQIALAEEICDVVWSIECTEHLFDKAGFFKRAAKWLRPGGKMAICAWLAGDTSDPARTRQVHDVCEGFFCPSLGTFGDYAAWMEAAGLRVEHALDWSLRVVRTWEICRNRIERSHIRWLARLLGRNSLLFLNRFDTILKAYRSGAMKYGCFVAHKPLSA